MQGMDEEELLDTPTTLRGGGVNSVGLFFPKLPLQKTH
jgi:hypothetical protein